MPRHAELESGFFKDPDIKKMLEVNPDAVLLYIYYTVSCPNLLGIYQTDEKDDRVSIRYPLKKFVKAKSSILQSGKIVFENGWVWVVGKGNRIKGRKQWICARKLLGELPKGLKLKDQFITKYRQDAIRYGYPIDRVSDVALPIPIPKKEELPKGNSEKSQNGKKPKSKTDPRVTRLLKFFGAVFKDTFGVIYKANFKGDGKIIKDQLQYAEKNYPTGYAEIGLAITMDEWLEKQKTLGEYKKTTIPGWLKDFNSINTEIDWDQIDWDQMKGEYEDAQKKEEKGIR